MEDIAFFNLIETLWNYVIAHVIVPYKRQLIFHYKRGI